jgi:hypothetical protein
LDGLRLTSTLSVRSSQSASSSALGLARSASTVAPVMRSVGSSSAAASSVRQGVSRVQDRSVSPGL